MTRSSRSMAAEESDSSEANSAVIEPDGDAHFQWVGSGVKEKRLMYFGRCIVEGVEVSVGDNVEIKLGENQSAVAEVLELFEQAGEDPHRAIIRWYYPFKDLPKRCKLHAKKLCDKSDKELFKAQEVFLGCEENIDAETIIGKASVTFVGVEDDKPEDSYFVRYMFSVNQNGDCIIPAVQETSEEEVVAEKKKTPRKSYTKVKEKGKSKVPTTVSKEDDTDSSTSSPCNGNDSDEKEDIELSGKMKKNAMKWKTFSADEVIAELWKTDEKDGSRVTKRSNGTLLKTTLKSTPKRDQLLNICNNDADLDTNLSPLDKKERGASGSDASGTVSKKIEFNLEDKLNKKVSPFKALPKKKKSKKLSVFDFDDGEPRDKPLSKKKPAIETFEDDSFEDELSDEFDGNFSPKKGQKKKRISENKSAKKSAKKAKVEATPSNGATPSAKKNLLDDKTPAISQRKDPLTHARTMLELARQRLHVSEVPETLPCRDLQFEQIFSFVQDRLKEGTGGCMYISGVPGTGKTATVHEVIRTLQESTDEALIPQFKYVEINGMKLTDPNQAYSQILKVLEGKKATPDHASDLLDQRFRSLSSEKENVVLLVDELDLLCTRKQNVMYNIFDWPTHQNSKLVVLAVANTMDLPERVMMNRVSSRLGLTRMTFQPYTFKELTEIVLSRIRWIEAFEEDALQLVARKVAAVSGDARRCLDICRRAVEISESMDTSRGKKKQNNGKGMVGMKHVELALKEMFSSPKIMALKCLSDMETMFMKAVISEFRRTGLEEALFIEVYDQFKSHCTLEDGIDPPNISETFKICNNLGSCRLLLVEAGDKDIHQRVRLNVNADDVLFAFKSRDS